MILELLILLHVDIMIIYTSRKFISQDYLPTCSQEYRMEDFDLTPHRPQLGIR